MKNKIAWPIATAVGLILSFSPKVMANDFYEGKTIRVAVGNAAGGGYDTYTRAVARHLGKHIPGNPEFVVDNMTGAEVSLPPTTLTTRPTVMARSLASGIAPMFCIKRSATGRSGLTRKNWAGSALRSRDRPIAASWRLRVWTALQTS